MAVLTWLNTFAKTYQTIHLKLVNFSICKLYLNKLDFKIILHTHYF